MCRWGPVHIGWERDAKVGLSWDVGDDISGFFRVGIINHGVGSGSGIKESGGEEAFREVRGGNVDAGALWDAEGE